MRNHNRVFLIVLGITLCNGCSFVKAPEQETNVLLTDQQLRQEESDSPAGILDATGDTLFFAGDYDNALLAYQQALEFREKTLGTDHIELVQNFYNLATTSEAKNDYIRATKLYKRSHKIAALKLGLNHSETRAIQGYISAIFDARGLIGSSKNDAHQHVSLYKRIGTGQHPLLGVALRKLANFYLQQKKIKRAETYFEEAIVAIEKSVGREHPYLAVILKDYALLLKQSGRNNEAFVYEKRIDDIYKKYPKKYQIKFYSKTAD